MMFIKIMNLVVGWFGYQYVLVENENKAQKDVTEEEDWDELIESSPSYKLVKKSTKN